MGKYSGYTYRKPSRKRTCTGCLWKWRNLQTGDGYTCYCEQSHRYHQEAVGGCGLFEMQLKPTDYKAVGKERKKHWKGFI